MDVDVIAGLLGADAAAFAARPHRNLIGGRWRSPREGESLDIVDPGTGNIVGHIPRSRAADIDLAVAAALRLLVDDRVFDRVVDGVTNIAKSLRIGHGLDPQTQLGPLVADVQLDRVMSYLDGSRDSSARHLTGGRRHGTAGYFVEPTVVVDTTPDMAIYREEVFGPVLCAVPFKADDLTAAVTRANDSLYGLHASIWPRDLRAAHQLAGRIKSGNVCINTHNFFDPAFPMGGYKQSGWGRAAGFPAIEHYTELKAVVARL